MPLLDHSSSLKNFSSLPSSSSFVFFFLLPPASLPLPLPLPPGLRSDPFRPLESPASASSSSSSASTTPLISGSPPGISTPSNFQPLSPASFCSSWRSSSIASGLRSIFSSSSSVSTWIWPPSALLLAVASISTSCPPSLPATKPRGGVRLGTAWPSSPVPSTCRPPMTTPPMLIPLDPFCAPFCAVSFSCLAATPLACDSSVFCLCYFAVLLFSTMSWLLMGWALVGFGGKKATSSQRRGVRISIKYVHVVTSLIQLIRSPLAPGLQWYCISMVLALPVRSLMVPPSSR